MAAVSTASPEKASSQLPKTRLEVRIQGAVKALTVLLRPAGILVFLPVLGRLRLPIGGRLAALYGLILLARVALPGYRHDGGIYYLPTASNVPLRAEMLVETIEQLLDQSSLSELL